MNSALKRIGGAAASLMVAAGLISGVSLVATTVAEAGDEMVTATTNVNVRTGPSTKHRVLGSLSTGQSLPTKGKAKNGWTPVTYSGTSAWISSDYVVLSDSDAEADDAKPSKGWRWGTVALNVRTGPSISSPIVTVAGKGYGFQVTGATKNGFSEVNFKGKSRWVTTQYLSPDKPGSKTPDAKKTWRYGTTNLNVRTDPSLRAKVVDVAGRGYGFIYHGRQENGFAEVTFKGKTRWVSARYLSETKPSGTSQPKEPMPSGAKPAPKPAPKPKPETKPAPVGNAKGVWRYGTTALNVRTEPRKSAPIVNVAGRGYGFLFHEVVENGYAQVTFQGKKRWVSAQYLSEKRPQGEAAGPKAPAKPKVTGVRYATTLLAIRTASRGGSTITDVKTGTKLEITGKVEHGRAQVVYKGAVRWVTAQYLSKETPRQNAQDDTDGRGGKVTVTGESGLTSNSRYLLARLKARYPQVTTYHGVRPDAIPDHPSGKALDAMLPNYRSASSRALGKDMAEWIKNNASQLNVEYIIYDQRIWNVRRSGEGWRYMADRGSDNANHKNHIHVTTF
ncbi:SH3 domain-containing protein [Desertihabitans aurantiacus]|uniref:SH3 domain-containing protein n=1 Tax=Desertihabitans aurantiacus TaxID=2282477 RepID=UPI0013009D8B|nr:SH3 domain-containing protein [Desertihabitans aurantiacus]